MTRGIGGVSKADALAKLSNMRAHAKPIAKSEYHSRIQKAQSLMAQQQIDVILLNAGTNLQYFTGTRWPASERLVCALLPAHGDILYVAPDFETGTLEDYMLIEGRIHGWHEHENPYQQVAQCLGNLSINHKTLALDESAAFFIFEGLRQALPGFDIVSAQAITQGCRAQKSANELALMQTAKNMTLAVQQSTASVLCEGISTDEVAAFIDDAHRAVGASGSSFCIVLFGTDTAFPHGVKTPKPLAANDMVLIDTGCLVQGYQSDITRSYVFGEANERQRKMWQIEKDAQAAAFNAAIPGASCGSVDDAAREYLSAQGLGPDYQLPGLPHRTGHGIGLDIHEGPYLVRGESTRLQAGMCFSNEPMLVVPGEFGVRLEDHFYMTDSGPQWFTKPSPSIDDPFGLGD